MKKILLSAALAMLTIITYAQPVLTGAQINPTAGEVFFGHQVSPEPDTVGPSGAGVTWNFGGLMTASLDTSTFVSCTSTPYCDSFPGSTIAIASTAGDYTYFTTNAGAWTVNGYYTSGMLVHYTDPSVFVSYPFTFHSTHVDTVVMPYPGGFVMTETDSSYADAYGTLILPSGTFPNTLRIYTYSISETIIPGYPASYDTSARYTWYSPGFHAPLLSMNLDHSTGSWEIGYASYLTTLNTVAVNDIAKTIASLRAYPNPATDFINVTIALNSAEHVTLTLSDVTGKTIEMRDADLKAGNNEISIPATEMAAGMYLLRVRSANETLTSKISVVR